MAEEEEYEEVVEYYIEEEIEEGEPAEIYTEVTETTYTTGSTQYSTVTTKESSGTTQKSTPSAPVRKKVVRTKVDTSKFLTPYLEHSSKMQKLFSDKKYKEKFEKERGKPCGITTDTPELRRIKKVQDQLSEVKYRMAGDVAKTDCHIDEKARDIEHAKKVSQQVSKVLYKQNWEENKEKYLLPPDAPELVQAIKNTALFSKKPYIEDWESDKTMFYPYDDSPELRRVAQAQKALSDIVYKKGHDERKAKYTSLPDPPDVELAKKVTRQLSDLKYHEDYEKKIKGKWSQTPCYDVAVAKMNADNFSMRKYQEDWENKKDQIYFMQTETPEYAVNKRAGLTASKVKYREDYEKSKASTDYNVLPATENPVLRHLKAVGNLVNDRLYKEGYEKAKGSSINYCDTPKYQIDSVLKNFGDVKYKEAYQNNILGRYIGSYEDPYQAHCMKVAAMKSDKNYKADYEEDKAKCYFPQTITQEYEALKKLDQVKDYTYKKHPDQIKFTPVTDSPVQVQAQINSKQLSDLNYKAKHEKEKFKCSVPPDAPFFIQSQVNAYNLSDNWYKYDWERSKAKKFEIKFDAIPILAAKANRKIASDVEYKKAYEQSKGKLVGALSIHDDPKMLHSLKVAKQQSDRLYKEGYEKGKGISINYCDTPKYQVDSVLKNFGDVKYKEAYQNNILGRYIGSYEDPYQAHCMKVAAMKSDKNYKADYEEDKAKCYFPQTITQEYEALKKLDLCKDYTYKKHPDQIKFTPVTDSLVQVQAQINSKQLSDLNYKAKHESEKFKCSIPPDAPLFLQSRVNAYNLSDNWYKYDWEQSKAKKFEIKVDAIPVIAAKANRKIASDVEYKKGYEQSKGKLIGALSIHDDPKMLHSRKMAKQQSDREYKKGYEESKTKYTAPLDMIPVVQAKKTQAIVSNADYKHLIHNYSYPPDSVNVELAKKSYAIQSDNEYKADYNSWMKGCGWVPFGSLEVEKAKRASDIISERKYRQHPDTLKFTSIEDEPVIVQAKINQAQRSDVLYKAKNEDIIHKYNLPADAPQFIQAKVNSYNMSDTYYKLGLEELKTKGYDLRNDAIPIKAAKAARHAASDFQYKKDYESAKGKLIGFQSLQDDPKLVHYMNVAKMQSEREYRKGYEQSKTKYNTPLDMVNVVNAKKAQEIASNTNYKHLLHHYTFLPDAMSLELSKNMMQIQSDNLYKSDFNSWMKGIGWIPIGSLDVEKARKAGEAMNEKNYRQHPDTIKFTSVVDSPVMVQAKQNALQLSDRLYKSSGEEVKHKYNLPADAPQFIQAKYNAANISDIYYKLGYQDLIAKGHHVLGDSIPITLAKASRNIASDFKYKEAYEKARGKHVGFRSLQDDPKLVHSMHVAKMQSDREYRKDYEKSKTSYHTPVEMVSIQAAKQAQDVASNSNYKHLVHHYTCLPDAMSVELARNRMQIQSDNVYKQDYNTWFKGIGWSPLGSLDVEKVRKAGEALEEHKYRQHPATFKFTSLPDSMPMVLAKQNTKQLSDINYKVEGEKVKHTYHLDPDLPQFIQARVNAYNISDGYYKADWKKLIAKGYDLKPDAISIIAAKGSRNIASDYKYKEAYEKDKGKQVGFRSLQDDPKLVHYMNVAKLQSDRLYKKDYESSKTKYHTPFDMFSVTAAKKAQEVVTDTNYRQYLHNYTLLPDAMSMELSRNRMQIQSDNLYRADFSNWLRGVGWVPIQSLEVEKAIKATDILNERKYRQHPDKLKYTLDMDSMEQVLAKQNALTMNKRLYVDKWNKDKTEIHVMPDTPEILLSKANQVTMSNKLYKSGWEEDRKKGYDLRPDAISIKAAKASRDIASDYKYKLAFEQAKGKHIGFRSLEDDPKLVHFMQVAKMQSEREYKKDYEKSKTRFHTPVDMFSVVAAKKAQEVATDTNYRSIIHTYNVMPDAMNLELAKNMMQIQSNNQYKADYDEFMKGVGWVPLGSLEAEKNKKAMEIVSDTKYRQHPDKLKYSILMDSMPMVLATSNAKIMDEHLYKKDWEADKTKIHIMPDIPEILLAKANAFNISNKMYRLSLEEAKKKGCDLRADAIPIQAAKASRDIASDYKYKLGYEKDKGKLVGFRSLQDDPKLVHYMQVAKMQSDREYKKAYEISKTRYNTPADTFSVMAAKEAQANITNTNYKRLIHKYILLPDSVQVELSRNMNRIQSNLEYKQDYNEWYKGLGWSPAGSLDVEKSKKATEIASDTKYRQHPSAFPFTKKMDSMDMELAKYNAGVMNKHAYIEAWEKDKRTIHVMPDTPDIMLAKANKSNYSEKMYKLGWHEMIKKGYDLTAEAISVKAAKASRDIASEYKYKEGYRKQQGHHIGFRNLQDDPKLVHSMNIAKMQSEREYKKDFEKWKTKINLPVDMIAFLMAKNCQHLVSDTDYRRIIHQWTCLPDQTDVIHAKKVYELQSDNAYKSDLQWLQGVGWNSYGSLESEKNKKASEILSEKNYRQPPDTVKFTSIADSMEVVLAKENAKHRSDKLYREAWDKDKTQIHIMPDTPEIILARANLLNTSDKLYKLGLEELKKKGYNLPIDAIPIKAAKASRDIASEYKYKDGYRKQLGHHIGARSIQDDPKLVHSMNVAKMQSEREYKKDFEKWKTKYNTPVDMLGILLAKNCQKLVTDIDYRNYLHQWTCLPDQNDVVHARKTYDLQSDNVYKSDLEWLRGVGWSPSGSLEAEKNKRASQILSDYTYRQHPDTLKFTSPIDSMPMALAKHNSEVMNHRMYVDAWNKDKTSIHIMPDTPEILLSQQNKINFSEKLYKLSLEEARQKGYDLRVDAIPIKAAKASRDIASDYKYKEGYRKQLGHHVGARSVQDDPKIVHSMNVAKMQSEREYKKDFEKWKTKYTTPVDMLGVLLAKNCQKLVSEVDYRNYLHQWTCLPDQNDVIHARKAYELQSDAIYKSDLEWLRGIGWMPNDSVIVNHVKNAQDILSERKYRTKVDSQKFTPVADRVDYITAKQSGEILSDIKYHQEWNNIKTNYTLTETPQLEAAKEAARILNHNLYKENWEKQKSTGYFLPPDSVPIRHAKHSNDVQSELKYKADYVKQKGHYVGVQNMREDPKLVWFEHAGKIQNDRLYKDAYNKTKSKIHIPPDILSVIAAKDCQTVVSEIPYRTYLHEWTCHPDQNDCIQARKAYDLQSDNIYKSDLEWIRGCGWIPLDSVEHRKVKKAQDLINKRIYTKDAIDSFSKFTSVTDAPDVVLAKANSIIQSDLKYKETFNLEKGHYIGSEDTIALNHSRDVSKLYSDILYKDAWESGKAIGYTLPPDYIPIVGAKHADYVNSELKYKLEHEKQKGHYLAGTQINDFPSVVHSLAFQKIRSALAYRKNYEDTKAHIHIPSDMINHVLAKKCQYILSDLEYRTYLHQWNCSPEEHDVVMAKRAQEILSDVVYKDDLTWLKGIGCYVWDTPEILHAKKSYDLQSQLKYTKSGKENLKNYGIVLDTPVYVTALQSGMNASDVKYKEEYHKIKDQYTTVLETVDHERTQNLKNLFSNNLYKKAWEKVKSVTFTLPPDAVPFVRAKELKHNASIVKYREEYDKFKALYTLPRGVQDDPNTARCLKVGKLNIDRLYRDTYEKNKAKIHIVPDMVDIVSAKDTQKKVSEIDYRIRLHEWANIADPHAHAHARKVNDQLSDIVYKDDLNWLKGIGCFVWDTPEILHAKHAYDLRNDFKYKSKADKMKSKYSVVTHTPVYDQNVLSGMNLSEAVYRHDYVQNIRGKYTPVDKTVDLERAKNAYKIQCEGLYRNAGLHALPTGYTLPADTPGFKHAKHAQYIGSYLKYKEVYEHIKDKGYNFGPKAVPFVNIRKVNKVLNERLYRETYHKNKDKIHTTPDTPEIRQVKATQEAVSDLIYKTDFFKMQGHLISLPYTPQTMHSRYVGEITSDIKYKGDLEWLKGLGCFLYDTPDMVRARHLRNLWSHYVYTNSAKKLQDKYHVVLDTPVYRTIQELKTHLSDIVYRAVGNERKTKYTSILDTPDFHRAKTGQKLQSKYLYVELATKERPHHHAGDHTPALQLAKHVKDFASEKKYKSNYEKMKHKYVTIPDTPILIRAKKAYLNASDLRYKETFEQAKGKYHTVKDALDIVYHRKVTDDISKVKYKEKYMSQLGIWRSIPDRPDHFHHRAVTDAVSDFKYKEDLTWLKGIGCYAWDTPDLKLAEQNKALYSPYKYKESFEKIKSKFKYVADAPINIHLKYATQLMNEKLYKSDYEKKKDKYSVVVDDPRTLLAKLGGELSSQYKYKQLYEKQKDKFTSVVDTPEHLRTTKVNKQISDIIYKMEHVKARAKGYTTIHDTPMLLHVRKVKDRISDLKYKEVYQQNKSHCNVVPDSVHIKAAKQAYKVNSNLDYKKKYEATKAHWHWTVDRPDFIQNAKTSLQQSDYDYKYDLGYFRGCKISVTDDKNTVLALQNAILASDLKYKEKHNKERGTIHPVPDTPQILLAKAVSSLVSENKYKEHVKKHLPHGSFTKLPETRDTVHVKEVTKNVSETNYKKKFQKEKGKSNYSIMLEPPDVKHAMEVAKSQSNIQYKKDAKSKLNYTSVADRPDIKKASQVSKLVSDIQYKAKARGEAGMGVSMLGRPDIELAKEVSKLTSQAEYIKGHMRGHGAASYDTPTMRHFKKANVLSSHIKYKETFDKEKGKKPRYDLKDSKIYKTLQDAHHIASEVKYKADLKKLHKPVTDMSESLSMNHVLSTSQLASSYQYKKQYEESKGHYHVVPDNLEQLHLKEASELQSQVKYKEKYEKERGKPMLDFETPTYITAKEAQHMQSEKEYKKDFEESIKGRNLAGLEITPSLLHVRYATKIASEKEYRRDLEEGVKGKGLTILEETPDLLRAKNATHILNEKEYKRALELEIKGRGLTSLALETPDFMRAKNAMDIASQIKYKQSAEMEKANYTTVVDTPEIIHAHQVKNLSSQKKYKEEAERTMSYYVPVLDTPEMQRVRENQKNFSMLQYQQDMQHSKGKITVVNETPEILRVKENQKNFSTILYKEDIGTGTAIEKTPEMQRIKQTQDAISTIKYKENVGKGTPISDLPEVKRVKETQKHISSVLYKENAGQGIPTPVTPEIERVKRNQENISSVIYKENVGTGTATPVTPEMERVKRNQENVSLVLYKENVGKATPTPVTPEMERVKRSQEHISSVLYKEELGKGTPTPVTPEMERVKRNQEHISSVLYKEELGKGTPTPVTPEMERVKRNQEHISSVLYKEGLGKGTPIPVTPEMERVKHNQEHISSVLYKEGMGKGTPTPVTPEMERVKRNQEHISSVLYKEGLGKGTPTPVTPEMERVRRNQEHISSVLYKENLGQATPTPVTPEMERAKRNQENISLVLYKENLGKGTPTSVTPEMERAKRNQENISSVLYSDSFRKQVQGKAAFVLDTPEMRRVRETQRHISTVKYHEDFEKTKGSFTPVVTDPITERVKKNMQDFSDISYRGIQRKVVEIERKRVEQDQELNTLTDLRVWRTNPGSVFDYDPAEDNIQSRSLHLITVQAQRRSREQSRSASALSLSAGDEKSDHSETADQHLSYYSNGGFFTATTAVGYKQAKTVELPQQRSSSVATQQTTVSSIPSQPSTAGKTYRAMYDYMAADADEVSFKDGDTIMNVQAIDEGWMYGTVQRTGKTGMLPANYVEAV
ncbi:nebulin isoform X35 [Paroedura picta]|uniref:nebulin isoform X35 n=1 Tax=Paroedura picta TaxID=143630 RepID=UPI004057AADA